MIYLILLFVNISFSQENLTLKQAIENCLLNNYEIQIVKKTAEISENNVSKGNAGMLPTIDTRASYKYSNPNRRIEFAGNVQPPIIRDGANVENLAATVELNWTLFDGFAMFANYDKLKALNELSEIQFQIMIENKVRELVVSYLNALTLQENISTIKSSLELNRVRIEKIKDQIEYGVMTKSQLLQAEVDYNTDSTSLLTTILSYENALRSLNYSMGLKYDKRFKLANKLEFENIQDFNQIKEKVFSKNSSINLAILNKDINALDYDVILSNYYPRVNLTGDFVYNRNTDDANFTTLIQNSGPSLSLNASWNLYNGNKNSITLQNNLILSEQREVEIQNIKASIELNLINLFESYKKQKEIVDLETRNVKIAEENFQRAFEEFRFSKITSVELRQAQLNLIRNETNIIKSKNDLKNIEAQILLLMGEMPN